YVDAGYNVLVIDPRAHGKSDGLYNTVGGSESRDALAWAKLIIEQYGMNTVYFHTICVGSVGAILALNSPDCPKQVKGLVTEGCFASFRETFRRHMKELHRPLFPVLDLVMLNIWRHTGTNPFATAPLRQVKRMKKDKRVLFLFGWQDIFSVPPMSQKLVDACTAEDKTLVWFDKGSHSHLRLTNPRQYDDAIRDFLAKDPSEEVNA
ncbi:MAG: alpha/beta hydrolase, partial [Acidaminococcaceae bacterium]|nr:alpha/beta hydrolase [Acidaminococcaceae bacterium]